MLAHTDARGAKPAPGLAFDPNALPKTTPLPKQTIEQLQRLETELRERDEKLTALLADKTALDAELTRLRAEIAETKKANTAQADTHNYSEAETRDYFIDLLLKEAGWALDQKRDREFPVAGMPNHEGKGFVDYVQWGDDGLPLGLIEAKRTKRDPRVGQQQAKLYADCLEKQFGRRPVIFYSNGYEHWIWDDANYPPRPVQGFYKQAELELLMQRRKTRRTLAGAAINAAIVDRYYQTRGVRRIGEAFEIDRDRKVLVVPATGGGKTRMVIALADLLVRCNWVKRILFLADRIALVNQAVGAFKKHLPDSSPVNLVTEKDTEGRVFVSTYNTMMSLIDETKDGQRRFGPGHFDVLVIDEAHRSVYQKYRAIFQYFWDCSLGIDGAFFEQIQEAAGGEVGQLLGGTVGLAPPAGQIDPEAVVVTFAGEAMSLALQMALRGEDQAVGVPEVGAEGDVGACGSGASRRRAVSVPRSPNAQPQTCLLTRSIAHHSQQGVFFAHVRPEFIGLHPRHCRRLGRG